MKDITRQLVLVLVTASTLACGTASGEKAAGELCTLTSEGATECSSNVCLEVVCPDEDDTKKNVCAGPACETNDDCPDDSQCVAEQNVCVPDSTCD